MWVDWIYFLYIYIFRHLVYSCTVRLISNYVGLRTYIFFLSHKLLEFGYTMPTKLNTCVLILKINLSFKMWSSLYRNCFACIRTLSVIWFQYSSFEKKIFLKLYWNKGIKNSIKKNFKSFKENVFKNKYKYSILCHVMFIKLL